MTTKRRPINRPPQGVRLTPKIIAVYKRARRLEIEVDDYNREDAGHRRRRLDAAFELHELLGRKPWQENVIDTVGFAAPPHWMTDARERRAWEEAHALEKKLANAAGLP